MIKGVSKQILEVTNTDNPYFEKIIFFVKPEHQSTDRKKLQKEAEAVATKKQKPPKLKLTKKQIVKTALLSLLFTMAGCGITFVISLLIAKEILSFVDYADGFVLYTEELKEGGNKKDRNVVSNSSVFLHDGECTLKTYDSVDADETILKPKYKFKIIGYITWTPLEKETI